MNCLEFESRTEILARDTLADARTRAAAEAHAESCAACAARLADERALSVGLRALAAETKGAEAPARVEGSLLAAFRAQASSSAEVSSEAVAAPSVVALSGHAPARRLSWVKTVAVAALAAAASLALFVLVRPDAPRQAPAQRAMIVPPPDAHSGMPPTVAQNGSPERDDENVVSGPTPEVSSRGASSRTTFPPRARAANVSYGTPRPRPADTRAEEVATDFIPLVQAGPYTQAEEGHLVRVELPRAALASFGLPLNAEAPSGRVKADVLMGQDGIARAIRFVR